MNVFEEYLNSEDLEKLWRTSIDYKNVDQLWRTSIGYTNVDNLRSPSESPL